MTAEMRLNLLRKISQGTSTLIPNREPEQSHFLNGLRGRHKPKFIEVTIAQQRALAQSYVYTDSCDRGTVFGNARMTCLNELREAVCQNGHWSRSLKMISSFVSQ
jgi:hypothetical protein